MLIAYKNKLPLLRNYIRIKHFFKNGIIYNYKGKWKYREGLGMSRNCFNNNIREFIKLGWATEVNGTIYLTGKVKISKNISKKNCNTYIPIDVSKDILEQLQLEIVERKLNQIRYAYVHEKASNLSIRDPKFLKRFVKEQNQNLEAAFLVCPLMAIAREFGCTKSHAHGILKKLRKSHLVQIRRRKTEFVGYYTLGEFYALELDRTGLFWHHGKVFRRFSCRYRLKPEKNLQKMLTKLFKDFRVLRSRAEDILKCMDINKELSIGMLHNTCSEN